MTRVYLAGPMTGYEHFNFPAFDAAAVDLRERGYEVVSPAELDSPAARAAALASKDGDTAHYAEGDSWGTLLARDVKLIADEGIEAIVALPGWGVSRGAKLETFVGRLCDLPILEYPSLEPVSDKVIAAVHAAGRSGDRWLFEEGSNVGHLAQVSEARAPKKVVTFVPANEIRVTDEKTGGQKGLKLAQLGALDPDAIMSVAEVAGFGATKYERMNYLRGFDWSLAFDAAMRHGMEFWAGRETDPESGLPHAAHAAWQWLCLLSFATRGLGTDDRICAGRHLKEASCPT